MSEVLYPWTPLGGTFPCEVLRLFLHGTVSPDFTGLGSRNPHRGTSLTRKRTPLGPYRKPMYLIPNPKP